MDVRVKLNSSDSKKISPRQEIITGLPGASVRKLLDTLSSRHPELAPIFTEAKEEREFRIYVNDTQVPTDAAPRYFLHDGDTVSLFVKP